MGRVRVFDFGALAAAARHKPDLTWKRSCAAPHQSIPVSRLRPIVVTDAGRNQWRVWVGVANIIGPKYAIKSAKTLVSRSYRLFRQSERVNPARAS